MNLSKGQVFRDLAYVTNGHDRQKLDLYLPEGAGPFPLIIWVHGGAFREGSKENPVPLAYLAEGFAVASLNYRLSQHAIFPAQVQDCKSAVRWLRKHAGDYHLDAQRIVAWGESAGGHLAAMLGVTGGADAFDVGENLDVSSRVQAVVDFFGPTDFLQMDAHRPTGGMVHELPDSPESQLVGGLITELPEAVRQANPVTYASPKACPFLIVHGDCDPLVPYHQSELLAAALREAGGPVMFYTVVGGGHGGFSDPQVPVAVREFLKRLV